MDFYWNLPALLLDRNGVDLDTTREMAYWITQLFAGFLRLQMTTACSSSRHKDANFTVNLSPDWSLKWSQEWLLSQSRIDARYNVDCIFRQARFGYTSSPSEQHSVIDHLERLSHMVSSSEIILRNIFSKTHVFVCDVCGNLDPNVWEDEETRRVCCGDLHESSSRCAACDIILSGLSKMVPGPLPLHATYLYSPISHRSPQLICEDASGKSRALEFFVEEGAF